MFSRVFIILLLPVLAAAQAKVGELHIGLVDPSGLPVQGTAELTSQANEYKQSFRADTAGHIVAKRLPFGAC